MTVAAPIGPDTKTIQSLICGWTTVPSLTLQTADSGIDLDSEVPAARIIKVPGGTLVVPCALYDARATGVTTSPQVLMLGRNGSGAWHLLTSKGGSAAATLTLNPGTATGNDPSDGTYRRSRVDPTTQAFDMAGCDQICPLLSVAANVSGGSSSNAVSGLELKFI